MSYGIWIDNNAGRTLIDEKYRNVVLRNSWQGVTTTDIDTVTVANGGREGSSISYTFSRANYNAPIYVVYSSSHYLTIAQTDQSPTSWTFAVISSGPPGSTFELYIFDIPLDSFGYGMRIKRADNSLAFNSAYRPLRYGGFMDTPKATSNSFSFTAGRKYGAAIIGIADDLVTDTPFITGGVTTQPGFDGANHGSATYKRSNWRIVGARAISGGMEVTPIFWDSKYWWPSSLTVNPGSPQVDGSMFAVDITGYPLIS